MHLTVADEPEPVIIQVMQRVVLWVCANSTRFDPPHELIVWIKGPDNCPLANLNDV